MRDAASKLHVIVKSILKVLGVVALVVVAAAAAYWMFHVISVRWPHRVRADPGSFSVDGRYYWVDIDGVEGIAVHGRRVLVNGTRLNSSLFGNWFQGTAAETVRELPAIFGDAAPTATWELADADYVTGGRRYTFRHVRSRRTISIYLPSGSAELHFRVLETPEAALIVFASGNWKVGPESYFGYVAVRPPA